jgi:hypothetical protein
MMVNSTFSVPKSFVKNGLILCPTRQVLFVRMPLCFASVILICAAVIFCRLHLKKKIQLLEEYVTRSSQDEERQRSHYMASTAAIQGHLPPMTPGSTFMMDSSRFQSQVYIGNEPGNGDLCYSSAPYSCSDNLSTPLHSVWREYTPKVIDTNYTEGSADKRWSSTNFPWTKELEVSLSSKSDVNYFHHH